MATQEDYKQLEIRVRENEHKLIAGKKDFEYIKEKLEKIEERIKPFVTVKAAAALGAAFGSPIAAAIMAVWGS